MERRIVAQQSSPSKKRTILFNSARISMATKHMHEIPTGPKQRSQLKTIIILLIDLVFSLAYISIMMPLLGWFLDTSRDWTTVTFGEFFDGKKWWFNIFILSLFYVPIRFLLRDELWRIIFKEDERKLS